LIAGFFVREKSGKLRALLSLHREAFNVFVKALRVGLGQLIIFIDFITRPGKKQRPPSTGTGQRRRQRPDPVSVPRLPVLRENPPHPASPECAGGTEGREEQRTGSPDPAGQGGKIKVPCLRIEENGQTTWMYESKVIIDYLDKRFAAV
jgi:hypothetical protein